MGETTVIVVGEWGYNDLTNSATKRDEYSHYIATGMESNTSIVYPLTMQWYFDYVLAYPIDLIIDANTIATYYSLPEVQDMPSFPSIGCTLMVDDVLVVKLSEYP